MAMDWLGSPSWAMDWLGSPSWAMDCLGSLSWAWIGEVLSLRAWGGVTRKKSRAPPQCQDNSQQFTTIHRAMKMSLNRGLLNFFKLCLLLTSQLRQRFRNLCVPYPKMSN